MAYIDREKAQAFLRFECLAKYPASFANGLFAAADQLANTPAADVVEVKHGYWRKMYDKAPRYVCSACNHLFNNKEYKFCPNCGAKMDGRRDT